MESAESVAITRPRRQPDSNRGGVSRKANRLPPLVRDLMVSARLEAGGCTLEMEAEATWSQFATSIFRSSSPATTADWTKRWRLIVYPPLPRQLEIKPALRATETVVETSDTGQPGSGWLLLP
ncbi:unnamed protein product [Protopolystoma xenopodis]|uniref:Uncharacterized protein n=1 Tax=Protopolystoma xenopodis TaxID=117903 RepID=A0A3S5CT02_9PLAT|nr:unnamed protein product [Protopolystoma xenopodis]